MRPTKTRTATLNPLFWAGAAFLLGMLAFALAAIASSLEAERPRP